MARWLRDYLSFGSRRSPPEPPKPDYTESEILRAYRAQKSLDFEDPYEERDADTGGPGSPARLGGLEVTFMSPRHRLIKVEPAQPGRSGRARLAAAEEEVSDKVTAGSEYSDPFDSKNEEIFDNEELENTSYMEPYEIQRQTAGLHWIGERATERGVQLYDSPYEERCRRTPRDSRQPPEDERPADEYDQPWEWKKDDINRAFAVQFEGSDWGRSSSPGRERLLQPKPRSPGGIRPHSPSPSPERVPPGDRGTLSLPLHRQDWYHGALSRSDAENRLYECALGGFLLRRESESEYYLSLRGCHSVLHVKVTRTHDCHFTMGESCPSFLSVLELVQHYIQHRLPVPGGEQLSLQCPVLAVTR
ncbi:SH2 domain-containing adapter protein D [Ascaphus truei]|uniref:SH2 domain-containing adapter protein D n=1 Tax=Ascaphus truei TaxID=8439 RepID=UPI003F5A2552